ncbi:MAG TPA: phosphatase PAP2 family protein [Flavisolibacter sp.]|nr:phosphatase PAP2 family protein [Flavisolibacter sp.]
MITRFSKGVKRFWARLLLLSVEMIVVLSLFVFALVIFVYITRGIFVLNKTSFDSRAFDFMSRFVSDRNSNFMRVITFLGTHNFLIPANLVLIAYFLFIRRDNWYSIKIPAIALTSLGLMTVLKHLFNRPRPDIPLLFEAKGLSFPSGHALMSVTFYGLLIFMIFRGRMNNGLKWTLIGLLVLLIVIIGLSRVYLRVHYASDVIAGYCMGFLWLVFAIWLLNRMEKYSRRKFNYVVEKPAVTTES